MSSPITLTYREKIPRSNNNNIFSVPSLTFKGLVLTQIDFMTEQWSFEAVLKTGSQDLVKMTTAYFQHNRSLDLSGYRTKIEEGDQLDLVIKPRSSPKDIELMICYTYVQSEGAIFYQNNERLIDLSESKMLSDIVDKMTPTHLYLKCETPVSQVSIRPKFLEDDLCQTYVQEVNENQVLENSSIDLDFFNNEELRALLPFMKYCEIKIESEESNAETQVYFMARGFKN